MDEAQELLDRFLAGEEVRGVTYEGLSEVFQVCGYLFVGKNGSHRTWKHPYHSRMIVVRDEGSRAMYSRYLDAAGTHIRKVKEEERRYETNDGR